MFQGRLSRIGNTPRVESFVKNSSHSSMVVINLLLYKVWKILYCW